MKVRVHFWSGASRDFDVPDDVLFSTFTKMAFDHGGRIKNVEFL